MYDRFVIFGAQSKVVEREFSIAGAATLELPTVDGNDWVGALQGNFSGNRSFGYPLVETAVFMDTGSVNINLQYRRPTFPINEETPVFTSTTTFLTTGAPALAWTQQTQRVVARFSRIQLERTGAVDPATGYVVQWVRGQ